MNKQTVIVLPKLTLAFARPMSDVPNTAGLPPKPEAATEYQSGWSYEKPVALGDWEWSSTFGRWGRNVTFANGWSGYTWPKTW